MNISLQRSAKYFCRDISGIREILNDIQANFQKCEEQTDYIFKIYDFTTATYSKRIKLRANKSKKSLVYIYSRLDNDTNVTFDFYESSDENLLPMFISLFNEPLMIRKRREVWELDNLLFHLDSVEGIGDIFEIETIGNGTATAEVLDEKSEIIKLFKDYLLEQIRGSNEDLLTQSSKYVADGGFT